MKVFSDQSSIGFLSEQLPQRQSFHVTTTFVLKSFFQPNHMNFSQLQLTFLHLEICQKEMTSLGRFTVSSHSSMKFSPAEKMKNNFLFSLAWLQYVA